MPPSAAERTLAEKSSLVITKGSTVGKTDEEPGGGGGEGGHRGFTKNYGVRGVDVSGIPVGIMGLLPRMSCAKAQQP